MASVSGQLRSLATSACGPDCRTDFPAVAPATLPQDVVLLLEVLARIERRRQLRLAEHRLEGLKEVS